MRSMENLLTISTFIHIYFRFFTFIPFHVSHFLDGLDDALLYARSSCGVDTQPEFLFESYTRAGTRRWGACRTSKRCFANENYYRKRNSYELFVILWHYNAHRHWHFMCDTVICDACVCVWIFLCYIFAARARCRFVLTRDEHLTNLFRFLFVWSVVGEVVDSGWCRQLFYNVVHKRRQKDIAFRRNKAHRGRRNRPHTR